MTSLAVVIRMTELKISINADGVTQLRLLVIALLLVSNDVIEWYLFNKYFYLLYLHEPQKGHTYIIRDETLLQLDKRHCYHKKERKQTHDVPIADLVSWPQRHCRSAIAAVP